MPSITDVSRLADPGLSDATYLFGRGGDSRFYVLRDSAVLSAFDLRADGSLVAGPSLSFASRGAFAGASERSVVVLSDTKAYLLDDRRSKR